MPASLAAFIGRWTPAQGSERANAQTFLSELCDVLDVPRPDVAVGDPKRDLYVFERDALMVHQGGVTTIGKMDLYKEGCFVLEAKQGTARRDSGDIGVKKRGHGERESDTWYAAMGGAKGQAVKYARFLTNPPPFLIVCDVGYCFDLYAAFDGGEHVAFPTGTNSRLFLTDLEKHRDTLRAVFLDPWSLDPSKRAARVTRDVALKLAQLAQRLEKKAHHPEDVATFLMRCLFTMFAEDVGLLPNLGERGDQEDGVFTHSLKKFWLPHPRSFPGGIEALWKAMNSGDQYGPIGKLLRFNGGLFKDPRSLPLDELDLELLLDAAKQNWSDVEPAIFGTLLERALDEKERHRLGAHFTPRAYVERLVKPTIEEPLRDDWLVVLTEARMLEKAGKADAAKKAIRAFHQKLCTLRVLDPACGSGNFLYVALDVFKRLEAEVLAQLAELGEEQTLLHMDTVRVTPAQFLGIEVKRWAKEIAELVLWIGYLQWHLRAYGKTIPVPEPVLQDYGNIECRDAVLAWDGEPELVRDENGKPVTRWNGESTKTHPVTGEDVPDETKRVPIYRYVNPRKAEWPRADFIVGNPPFVGNKRMRIALGDDYTRAVRVTNGTVPETIDFVMYWWQHAAELARAGELVRFGFITTNSIANRLNRPVVESALAGGSLVFAVPDHPWVDDEATADVRIAMTVFEPGPQREGTLAIANEEDDRPRTVGGVFPALEATNGRIDPSLRLGSGAVVPLRSNAGIAYQGVIPLGAGFRMTAEELRELGFDPADLPNVVKRYVIGRDIVQRPEERFVVDFYGMSESAAATAFPSLYQRVLTRVKPDRDQNRRETRRRNWWLFGENAPRLRAALAPLPRFIGTPDTSKFKPFVFLDSRTLPDVQVYSIVADDAYFLGVLSSRVHSAWLAVIAPRMGVGNDLRWKPAVVFLPFPFPVASAEHQSKIRQLAASLDTFRKRQQSLDETLTLTGMYNVLEKLRAGTELTEKEKVIHEQGLVSVLRKIHDDLDAAVFDAYGWPHDLTDEQILEKLVALNAERAEEERNGLIRWLRPEYQNPSGQKAATQTDLAGGEEADDEEAKPAVRAVAFPKKMAEQIGAVRDLVARGAGAWTTESVAASFKGAKRQQVEEVLESLSALGIVVAYEEDGARRWRAAKAA